MNRYLLLLLFISFSLGISAQERTPMSASELMSLYQSSKGQVLVENRILGDAVDAFFEEIDTLRKSTFFINCKFDQLSVDSIRTVDTLVFVRCELDYIDTRGSYFEGLLGFFNNKLERLSIHNSEFKSSVYIDNLEIERVQFIGNTLRNTPIKIILKSEIGNDLFDKPTPFRIQFFLGAESPMNEVEISGNSFESSDFFQTVLISLNVERLTIRDNDIQSNIDFNQTTVTNQFMFFGNIISKVSFAYMTFSETYNLVDWDDLKGFKILQTTLRTTERLGLSAKEIETFNFQSLYPPRAFYQAQSNVELDYQPLYDDLIRNYYSLYTSSRQFGNIRYANGIYFEIKEIEGRWLRNQYLKDQTFNSYFRWKLNRLMGFYTAHGTDPARSVMISILIILVFGVFYFFFPSDWDKESKATMILRFRELIAKDGVYIKPFFVLSLAIFLSFINGLTLSLNSFITLGFGQIPTHGLAKYACIIEGFLGWFLLTLFTVTLINQLQF